jgi:hypothetical protein
MLQNEFITRLSYMIDNFANDFVRQSKYSPSEGEYRAIPTSTEALYQYYVQARRLFTEKPRQIAFFDIGSGVGNALTALHQLAIADKVPSTLLVGVEKHLQLARRTNEYMDFFSVPPANRYPHLVDMGTLQGEAVMEVLIQKHAFKPEIKHGQNIVLLTRLFMDGLPQERVEDMMLRLMPARTIFIMPMSALGQFNNEEFFLKNYGIRKIHNHLFRKYEEVPATSTKARRVPRNMR